MNTNAALPGPTRFSRFIPGLAIVSTLAILGGTILLGTLQLRQKIRAQITQRDAQILHSVALWQQNADSATNGSRMESQADQLLMALQISRLRGVLAVRLFDSQGKFLIAFPGYITPADLDAQDLGALKRLQPVSRYRESARLADLSLLTLNDAESKRAPLLEVAIPIHLNEKTEFLGAAQLILDGRNVATEFAALDKHLAWQSVLAFVVGGAVLVTILLWAYHRLRRSNRMLQERTASLLRANHELTLAAKTSAVGSVTAHLIHGLRNPLSGLQNFMAQRAPAGQAAADDEWQEAVATTRRMQTLIDEIVRVLAEQNGTAHYEISLTELADILSAKVRPAAAVAGVDFQLQLSTQGMLVNRDANLILFILENLIQNAIQASPRGGTVQVTVASRDSAVVWEVRDQGTGLADPLRENLFTPSRSSKPGGSGLGLAISKQLANQLGAILELKSTGAQGTVFALRLAENLFANSSETFLVASDESASHKQPSLT